MAEPASRISSLNEEFQRAYAMKVGLALTLILSPVILLNVAEELSIFNIITINEDSPIILLFFLLWPLSLLSAILLPVYMSRRVKGRNLALLLTSEIIVYSAWLWLQLSPLDAYPSPSYWFVLLGVPGAGFVPATFTALAGYYLTKSGSANGLKPLLTLATALILIVGVAIGASFGLKLIQSPPSVTTSTSTVTNPIWQFEGAYVNYTGWSCDYYMFPENFTMNQCSTGSNHTVFVSIKVLRVNQTKVEYKITTSPFSRLDLPASYYDRWLNRNESMANLLCLHTSAPMNGTEVNITLKGNRIPALSYYCTVEPNDYGTVLTGRNVPVVVELTHYCTVCQSREEWKVSDTNIPGLLSKST